MTPSTAENIKRKHLTGKRLLMLAIILLLLYVVVPQIGDFKSSFHEIGRANLDWLALGLAATIGTYLMAAGQYYLLALKPIRPLRTFAVQCASAFTNRLLPAGIGGIGLNVAYLKKNNHTSAQAGVVIAVNNFLGLIGNVIIVLVIATVGVKVALNIDIPAWAYYLIVAVIAGVVLVLLLAKALRRKSLAILINVASNVLRYRLHPFKLLGALACAVALTLLYAATLYFCMQAIGWHLAPGKVFIVFIGSVVVATATPTPGGLIGAEAAITAGFTVYGLPASDGLAIALVYRLLTYWLPLVAGFGVFETLQHKRII